MRVFIITEGGKKIGLGHITRCISLYQAFLEKNVRPYFIIIADQGLKRFLENQNVKALVFNKNVKKDILKKLNSEDVAIIDSYLLPEGFYQRVGQKVKLLVSLDDFNRIRYPRGTVINGSIGAEKMGYPKTKELKYFLGTSFIPLRRAFWNTKNKPQAKDTKKILLIFGGFNSKFLKEIAIFLLRYSQFSLYAIDGVDNQNLDLENAEQLKIIKKASEFEMKNIMLKSDLAISGGGQTTYELARMGVPTIGICFADNQLNNLTSWSKIGFLKYAGWHDDKDILGKVRKELNDITLKQRLKMSEIGRKYVDGQGAKRIVEEILK